MQFKKVCIDSSHHDKPRISHATDTEMQNIWPQSANSKMLTAEDTIPSDILLEFVTAESKVNHLDSSCAHLVNSKGQGRQI